MLAEAQRYAAAVKPLGLAVETRQDFAAALHDAARPLVRAMRPRNERDVQKLDAVVISALAGTGIDPVGKLGLFARERVKEIAVLPWQAALFTGEVFPPQLANLQAWFDPTDLGTLTLETGDRVSAWANKGQAAVSATQATDGSRPTWVDAQVNGKPVLRYDGGDYLTLGTGTLGSTTLFATTGQAFTVFAVCKLALSATGTIIGRAAGASTDRTFQIFFNTLAQTPSINLRGNNTETNADIDDGTAHVIMVTWNGTAAAYRIDGGSSTAKTVGSAVEQTSENILLGARTSGGPTFMLTGDKMDDMIWDIALTSGEQDIVFEYLMAKWGIS